MALKEIRKINVVVLNIHWRFKSIPKSITQNDALHKVVQLRKKRNKLLQHPGFLWHGRKNARTIKNAFVEEMLPYSHFVTAFIKNPLKYYNTFVEKVLPYSHFMMDLFKNLTKYCNIFSTKSVAFFTFSGDQRATLFVQKHYKLRHFVSNY